MGNADDYSDCYKTTVAFIYVGNGLLKFVIVLPVACVVLAVLWWYVRGGGNICGGW